MRNKVTVVILCCMYNIGLNALNLYTSQIFMFTRPIFNSISVEQASWFDYGYNKQKHGCSIQAYGIFGNGIVSQKTNEYFSLNDRPETSIRGGTNPAHFTLTSQGYLADSPTQDNITTRSLNRDILGQWLNYDDVETVVFTLDPFQRQACGVIEINQDLKEFIDWELFESCFVGFQMPITYVMNNLGFSGSHRALEAFSTNNYRYANMYSCDMTWTAVTNAHFYFGTKYINENDIQIISAMGVIFPFTGHSNERYLFSPIQGYNGHFVLTSQIFFQFPLLKKNDRAQSRVCFFLDIENDFMARDWQMRTFDLYDKPYSRYLLLLDALTNELVPAMNAMTLRCRVEPYNIVNMATGLRFKYKDSVGEMGYELWAHQSERITVEPEEQWQANRYGIAFINADSELAYIDGAGTIQPLAPGQAGQTASTGDINHVGTPDGIVSCCTPGLTFFQRNKYISIDDFNPESAASRTAVTHRLYANVGFGHKGDRRDMFLNLGVYIEAVQNNSALSMMGGWIKFGLGF